MNVKEYKRLLETLYRARILNPDAGPNTEYGRGYMAAMEAAIRMLDDVKVVKPRTKKCEPLKIQLDYIEDLYNFEETYFGEKPTREREKELFERQIQGVIDICRKYCRPYDLVSIDELDD